MNRPEQGWRDRPKAGVLLALPIRAYQLLVSPLLPPSCRFLPSCSDYAREAIERHGVRRGVVLAMRRLVRCQPGGGPSIRDASATRSADGTAQPPDRDRTLARDSDRLPVRLSAAASAGPAAGRAGEH